MWYNLKRDKMNDQIEAKFTMLHENPLHAYRNEFSRHAPTPSDIALCYCGREILFIGGELPHIGQVPGAMECAEYAFMLGGDAHFLVSFDKPPMVSGGAMLSIDACRTLCPQHAGFAGITGSHLYRFYRDNAHCGRCGMPMQRSETERALCCPSCQNIIYPKISPAVIVGITSGERILLTKYAGRKQAHYALVAGFCEFGESVEATIRREAMEEVGLCVKNIRYFASQPWSFSDSLLLGFYCDVDGEDAPHADGVELCEATWFSRDEIPPHDSLISLTATMIDAFRAGHEGR